MSDLANVLSVRSSVVIDRMKSDLYTKNNANLNRRTGVKTNETNNPV